MRKLLFVPLAAALFLPSLAGADWEPSDRGARRQPRPAQAQPPPARSAPAPAIVAPDGRTRLLAPAPPRGDVRRPPPRVGHRGYGSYVLGVDYIPFWLGWSWGWGYYPLWPRPYYPGEEPGYRPEDARRVAARLEAYGAGASHAAAGTLAMALEGPVGGFNADVTGLSLSTDGRSGDAVLTLGGARATWSILSDAAFRLRLEVGGAMVSVPATGPWAGTSYANSMAFGPQVGASGHLGLVGPLGLEGYARVTPYPFPVFDAKAAVVLRGGPLAVSAGWRSIDVNGDRVDAPEAHFAGPELGLQLVF